jgi:hypothetical protein
LKRGKIWCIIKEKGENSMKFDKEAVNQLLKKIDDKQGEITVEYGALNEKLEMIKIMNEEEFNSLPLLLELGFKADDETEIKLKQQQLQEHFTALDEVRQKLMVLLGK